MSSYDSRYLQMQTSHQQCLSAPSDFERGGQRLGMLNRPVRILVYRSLRWLHRLQALGTLHQLFSQDTNINYETVQRFGLRPVSNPPTS